MTRHLSAVPDNTDPDIPRRNQSKWLVRVWQATSSDIMYVLLAEAIVDTEADAVVYARATHHAQAPTLPDSDDFVWVLAAPGHKNPTNGVWTALGDAQHALFTPAGALTAWVPGPRPTHGRGSR